MSHTDEKKHEEKTTENTGLKPDPETLHTTDPQKKMEGPVSSSVKDIGKAFSSDETPEEAEEKRESRM